jgi:hypothetical protein
LGRTFYQYLGRNPRRGNYTNVLKIIRVCRNRHYERSEAIQLSACSLWIASSLRSSQ